MTIWLTNHEILINLICNIFVAFGTTGAVVVALWFGYKDSKPKLRVNATVGIIYPDKSEFLWLSCVNVSKQSITCNQFALTPNRFKVDRFSLMRVPMLSPVSLPKNLQYSERMDQHFNINFLADKTFRNFLSRHKCIARIQLELLWRIVVSTNIKEFNGNLSKSLIDKILSIQFPNDHITSKSMDQESTVV